MYSHHFGLSANFRAEKRTKDIFGIDLEPRKGLRIFIANKNKGYG